MLSSLSSWLTYGKTFSAIEVVSKEGEEYYFLVTSQKKKGEFVDLAFTSIDSLESQVEKKAHAQLIINTDQVLIERTKARDTDNAMVSAAFPDLNISEFYYNIYISNDEAFIAICRKKEIDQIIANFNSSKIDAIGIFLGFGVIENILHLLGDDTYQTATYQLSLKDSAIMESVKLENHSQIEYEVDTISVPGNYLLPVAALIEYENSSESKNSNTEVLDQKLTDTFYQKTFFRKGATFIVIFLLVGLLINFLFYSNYFKEYNTLNEQVQLSENHLEQFQNRKAIVEQKEMQVNRILQGGTSYSSFYLNRIANSKPTTIQFTLLEFQPMLRGIRPDKPIEVATNQIVVSGQSDEKSEFSNWLDELDQMQWVSSVTVLEYGNQDNSTDQFSIKLEVSDVTQN